ncbi:MAG: alpha/beta fold hydrolase [Phycisphaerae bacterium]|nr:alpha/beta fold hydrolase [Gemmatimonadaceae bacterium]
MLKPEELTQREREILVLLAEGKTIKAIALHVNLAAETIRWYTKQIYSKLGVSSREDAVASAAQLGVIRAAITPATPVEKSPVRYLDNDGVSIAYQVFGRGPVDLLFIMGFVSHLEACWEEPGYAEFFEELARHNRIIMFDKRGVGLSDRAQGASTIDNTISDALAVLRAVGSARAFITGTSESGAAAVLMASMHPDLARGLILIAATPLPARQTNEPTWALPWDTFEERIASIKSTWGEPWALERLAPSRRGNVAFEGWWARALRVASSPSSVELILKQTMRVDIRAILPQVQTRTLVVHRTGDRVVNVGAGRHFAAAMPNARLLELSGDDHLFFVDGLPVARAMNQFIAEPEAEPEIDAWVAIVLHMAGAGSQLDDEKRRIIESRQPRAIAATSSGWVAMFDSPNRAVRCAQRLRELGRGRVGGMALHVGPCRTSDGVPVGASHAIALRLAALAAPGEVLVSSTLRDILAGSPVKLTPYALDGGDASWAASTVWQLASD